MKKSKTQMTKAELMSEIRQRDQIIADLNSRIDDLEHSVIQSSARAMDSDASKMLDILRKKIEQLEKNQSAPALPSITIRPESQG